MFKAAQWNFFFFFFNRMMLPRGSFLILWFYWLLGLAISVCKYLVPPENTHGPLHIADIHFLFLKFQVAVCSMLESRQSSTVCSLYLEQKRLSVTKCCVVPHLQPVFVYACTCCVDNTSETPGLATCAHLWCCHVYCHLSELPQTNVHSLS